MSISYALAMIFKWFLNWNDFQLKRFWNEMTETFQINLNDLHDYTLKAIQQNINQNLKWHFRVSGGNGASDEVLTIL